MSKKKIEIFKLALLNLNKKYLTNMESLIIIPIVTLIMIYLLIKIFINI